MARINLKGKERNRLAETYAHDLITTPDSMLDESMFGAPTSKDHFGDSVDRAKAEGKLQAFPRQGNFERPNEDNAEPTVMPERLNERYEHLGLRFDEPTPASVAADMAFRKRQEIAFEDAMSRSAGGIGQGLRLFTAALLTSALDPLELGLSFIPVAGPGTRIGKAIQRTSRMYPKRTVQGTVEGTAGAALIEPIHLRAAEQNQTRYSAEDSMLNIMLGGGVGALSHIGAGALSDAAAKSAQLRRQRAGVSEAVNNIAGGESVNRYTASNRVENPLQGRARDPKLVRANWDMNFGRKPFNMDRARVETGPARLGDRLEGPGPERPAEGVTGSTTENIHIGGALAGHLDMTPEQRLSTLRTGFAQLTSGRNVDVEPVIKAARSEFTPQAVESPEIEIGRFASRSDAEAEGAELGGQTSVRQEGEEFVLRRKADIRTDTDADGNPSVFGSREEAEFEADEIRRRENLDEKAADGQIVDEPEVIRVEDANGETRYAVMRGDPDDLEQAKESVIRTNLGAEQPSEPQGYTFEQAQGDSIHEFSPENTQEFDPGAIERTEAASERVPDFQDRNSMESYLKELEEELQEETDAFMGDEDMFESLDDTEAMIDESYDTTGDLAEDLANCAVRG